MNSSNNSAQQAYLSLDVWLGLFGSYLTFDYLYTYLITGLSIIGLGFNSISWLVLQKRTFSSNEFYRFMRVYTFNGIILSLILSTTFATTSFRLFGFVNSFAAIFYGTYFYTPLLSVFYLNSSLLEIIMVVERMIYFLPKRYKISKIIGFKKLCFILVGIGIVVSLPNYFIFSPSFFDAPLDENTTFRIHFMNVTPFSTTSLGQLLAFLMYFMRDILALIAKLILNSVLVVQVRKYLNKLKMEKLAFALKISSGSELHNQTIEISKDAYISKTDRNQTYIAIIMCFFSLLEHIFYIPSYVLFALRINSITSILYFLAVIALTSKHAINLFIFYKFNYLFRTELKKTFSKVFERNSKVEEDIV